MSNRKIKGAEATITFQENILLKKREEKSYRHPELDEKLREERTETEKKLTAEADRYGVTVPGVKKIDDSTLEIEKIEGETLKKKVEEQPELLKELGKNIAYLHSTDIVHGDLTTSNALAEEDTGNIYVIDLGLSFQSERIEDKAVDIHLLKQVLESSHPGVSEEAWEHFVEGYEEYRESEVVMDQLGEVERRGRYK